eukprot:g1942.t1 g1942   contig11:400298-401514(-)
MKSVAMRPAIGDTFPDIQGETQETTGFSLYNYLGDSWCCFLSHPADFTPVCTTELGAAQSLVEEFAIRDVKLCGFSCDDSKRHKDWISDIDAATGHRISFPLFCDPSRKYAIELGMLDPTLKDDEGMPLTVRAVFILNSAKEITLTMTYPACVGRNFDEILRAVDALQRAEKFGVVTPANWQPGDKTIVSLDLDDDAAMRKFGKGYSTLDLPSEQVRHLHKHYLRYTDDPVLTTRNKQRQSNKLASRIGQTMSWKPPKSFTKLPGRKRSAGSSQSFNQTTTQSNKDDNASTGQIDLSKSWSFLYRSIRNLKTEEIIEHPKDDSHRSLGRSRRARLLALGEFGRKKKDSLIIGFHGEEEKAESMEGLDDSIVW